MSQHIPVKPEDAQWNDEQWEAIYTKNVDLLISAGAGSGKTAVLVERIIQKLIHDQISVDQLLVLTFTEAAAQEMKQRVRSRIEKELIQRPNDSHLAQQLNKISQANISTFHSFCNKLIKRYYYLLSLDPVFKIADDIEVSMIQDDVIESLFNTLSETHDENYELLSQTFNNDRDEESLKIILIKIYELARSNPHMMLWLKELNHLFVWDEKDLSSWTYYHELIDMIRPYIMQAPKYLEEAKQHAMDSEMMGVAHKYPTDVYPEDSAYSKRLKDSLHESYETLRDAFKNTKLSAFPRSNKKNYDEQCHELSKEAREQFKKQITSISEKYFTYSNDTHRKHFEKSLELIKALESIVLQFHEEFTAAKLEKQILDFSDLEWNTLRLLVQDNEPTEVAYEIASLFKEVMVDEYQDTNSMQEFIINAIAKILDPAIPIFMVGDVKQSIYRFRLAEPSIFQGKYQDYQNEVGTGKKIDLMKNYRSHASVIDGTNFIFKQIMDEEVGEINYDEAALLKLGVEGEPYSDFHAAEVHLINKQTLQEDEQDLSVVELEAHHIARTIRHWVDTKQMIYDRKSQTDVAVRYQDIVILMRSLTNVTVFQDIFREYHIPLFTEQNTDLFDSVEIINILSALKIIDNPYQDIPLAGLMRSPLFFFTEQELAMIKSNTKATYFYDAVLMYGGGGQDSTLKTKVDAFIKTIENWRYLSHVTALSQLIRVIYEQTMYYDFVTGLPHGYLRKANLDVFYDKAKAYESLTKKGVFGFVKYIERMKVLGKHFAKAKTVTANENVVRIMSIHKSKGLEFPIVFVSQIHKKFNDRDELGNYLLHKKYGIAVKYIDPILRLKQKTIVQSVVSQKIHEEMIAEEMRLLYVAMTRAKTKLIFTGVFDVEKKISKLKDIVSTSNWLLPIENRKKAKNYGDWIIPAVLRQPNRGESISELLEGHAKTLVDNSTWEIKIIDELAASYETPEEHNPIELKSRNIDLSAYFNPIYEFDSLININAKQSVSQRKAEETIPLIKGIPSAMKSIAYDKPSFMQKNKLSGAMVGTALHNYMQHLPVKDKHSLDSLHALKDELIASEILSKEIAQALDFTAILLFTQHPLYQKLTSARTVKKEVPFMTLVQIESNPQSKILLQGVIDLLAEFDSEVWIIDYKTDFISDFKNQKEELKSRYFVQMKYYFKAIKEMYPNKLVSCYVYFLKVQQPILYTIDDFEQ